MNDPLKQRLVERIDALLPQTQCRECGYPGCMPYARAIVEGERIGKCPPGGQATVHALAALLDVQEVPVESGIAEPPTLLARIREEECIGCTKCIQACPVDAIVGAAKLMHTVIADECTGCNLCVPPCPVDCIDMVEVDFSLSRQTDPTTIALARQHKANHSRQRFLQRQERLQRTEQRDRQERQARLEQQSRETQPRPGHSQASDGGEQAAEQKKLRVAANMAQVALNKARQQMASRPNPQLAAQVEQLRIASEKAQAALTQAAPRPDLAVTPRPAGVEALRRAKVHLVSCRSALKKAQQEGAEANQLQRLGEALAEAERQLHTAEDASGKTPPDLQRTYTRPVTPASQAIKTELAFARAELRKLQRDTQASAERLGAAQERLRQAEQRLQELEKPAEPI
ncbi:electron transport complex subunit RsxB [Pseudomonas sp. ABC1]|uniref:electron transport complex subunit RsxB n=1 Tax=Pseudomonas sp. ABC1 TaxID=2748080 RepID=UPI00211A4318|nr:electron transport complex subunit RsxB [Pseudomonas sp. ABC1]